MVRAIEDCNADGYQFQGYMEASDIRAMESL